MITVMMRVGKMLNEDLEHMRQLQVKVMGGGERNNFFAKVFSWV